MYDSVSEEKGILKLQPEDTSKVVKIKKDSSLILKSLPLQKRRTPFTARVGEKKERMLKASTISIIDKEEHGVQEEIVGCAEMEDCESFVQDLHNDSGQDQTDDLFDNAAPGPSNEQLWPSLFPSIREHITCKDLRCLSGCEMLSNSIIHIFEQMMRRQYQYAEGLQDPVLMQRDAFKSLQDT